MRATTAKAFVPLSFAPGEAYQFDWSHDIVLIGGTTVTVKVAHLRLCHSRMMFVRAYPRESQEMVFDAHDRAFAFFKGACRRGIYDNMKTAVETIFVSKERGYNRRFLQMCAHHLVEPVACSPGIGLGEGPGREPGRAGARALLHPAITREELRRAERPAARSLRRLRQGASSPRTDRPHRVGDVRGRAAAPRAPRWPVRRLPRAAGIGLEDLPRSLRQQQVLGQRQRRRTTCRDPGLCRSRGDPPGRPHRRRTSSGLRPRRDDLRSLALRPRSRPQARRAAQRRPVQGLGPAAGDRSHPPQARRLRRRRPADGEDTLGGPQRRPTGRSRRPAPRRCARASSSADVVINIVARRRDPGPPITIATPDALVLRHAPIADCARYDSLRSI